MLMDYVGNAVRQLLTAYSEKYETAEFLDGDPSWFMHQVEADKDVEAIAFVASCLSYGKRSQFMAKIQYILNCSQGNVHDWIVYRRYAAHICDDDTCFYRLYTGHTMIRFLDAYRDLLIKHTTLGHYVHERAATGIDAVKAICGYFSQHGIESIIPKDTTSACKRVCMFLRWMVRDGSPVDTGLWSGFIDKKTLIIPLDTHVLQEAFKLGLVSSKTASMAAAIKLTRNLAEIFPDDPLKGDFALFGYGVDGNK